VADINAVLLLHHLILAVGHIAKGFPTLSMRATSPSGRWVEVFKTATQVVLDVSKAMSGFLIIREAVSP
jgi:exportin-T